MLEFRKNKFNSNLEVYTEDGLALLGTLTPYNDLKYWTFDTGYAYLFAEDLIEIADKLKELNENQ